MTELHELEAEVAPPKKAAKTDEDNTTNRKTYKQEASEFEPKDKMTMEVLQRIPRLLVKRWRYRQSISQRLQRFSLQLWCIFI